MRSLLPCLGWVPQPTAHSKDDERHDVAQVCVLEGSGDFLGAQRLLLLCALAEQQPGALFHASLAMRSTAQELRCLHVSTGFNDPGGQ